MKKLIMLWLILAVFPLNGELDSVWRRMIKPGNNNYRAVSVAVDSQNNYVVTGYGTLPDEMWVFKLSSMGDTLWSFHVPSERATDVAVDNNGDYIVVGLNITNNFLSIRKLDGETGGEVWTRFFSGYLSSSPRISIDRHGFIVVVSMKAQGTYFSIEIMKISPDGGQIVWERSLSHRGLSEWIKGILIDRDGNYIVSADSIYKIDASNGNVMWTMNYSRLPITIDKQGNYILAGDTAYSFYANQLWLTKIDPSSLTRIWTVKQPFPSNLNVYSVDPFSVIADRNNYYVIAGSANDGYAFHPAIAIFSPFKGNYVYRLLETNINGQFFSVSVDTSGDYVAVGVEIDSGAFFIEKFTPIDREIMWIDTTRVMHTSGAQKIYIDSQGNYLLPFDISISSASTVIGVTTIDSSLGEVISTVAGTTSYFNTEDAILDSHGNLVYLGERTLKKFNINTRDLVEFSYDSLRNVFLTRVACLPGGDYIVAGSVWGQSYGPFIARVDQETGEIVWMNSDYIPGNPSVTAMTVDNQGDIVLGGYTFPDTLFVFKITPGGYLEWLSIYRGLLYYEVDNISIDRYGNYLVSVSPRYSGDSSYIFRIDRDSGALLWQTSLPAADFITRDDPNTDFVVAMGQYFQARLDISTGSLIFSKCYDSHSGYHGPAECWSVYGFTIDPAGHYLVSGERLADGTGIFTKLYGISPSLAVDEEDIKVSVTNYESFTSIHGLNFTMEFEHDQVVHMKVFCVDGGKVVDVRRVVRNGVNHFHFPLRAGVYFIDLHMGKKRIRMKAVVVK